MAKQISLPLYEKYWIKHRFYRALDILILLLLLLLLAYRIVNICVNNYTNYTWLIALLCESWFTSYWLLVVSTKWSHAKIITYPGRLFQRVSEGELPPVDLFVTTADPVLEPPIITVNTVLSLMATEYPAHKLACYVSDDGCSPLTYYALVQASKFAKLWVPFCKKYNVQVRAPFRYFSDEAIAIDEESSQEFKQEWLQMKDEYQQLASQIADMERNSTSRQIEGEFTIFSNTEPKNHPTIIKVLWENREGLPDGLPHLIYVSREKRPNHPHHYKAGAMNVLARVSGLITNAPYMLNVDCDMFVNNPKIIQHTMCILLDPKGQREVAFVQFNQGFYDGLKDDPFGNQFAVVIAYLLPGMGGLQGPLYCGTNCFHRRKVIYGLSPTFEIEQEKTSDEELMQKFGGSKEFMKSAADALEEKTNPSCHNICNSLEAASQVASSGYEYGSGWGNQVGWLYGSQTEDVLTGLNIHKKGWRSEMCTPDPISFMGCAPSGGPNSMTQQKRWAAGLLELFFSNHNPIFSTMFGKLQFRECLAYMWLINWALQSIFEVCYVALLAYCAISNSNLLPKGRGLWIPAAIFVTHSIYTILEYLSIGLSLRAWWNNQRMSRIMAMNAWFFGFLTVIHKLLGISETVFEITQKDQPTSADTVNSDFDVGRFTFDKSPIFVPGTSILLIHLTALIFYFMALQPNARSENNGSGLAEMFCSAYLVILYWPFLKGLFSKGKYGIPLPTICKSGALAFLFVHFSRSFTMG